MVNSLKKSIINIKPVLFSHKHNPENYPPPQWRDKPLKIQMQIDSSNDPSQHLHIALSYNNIGGFTETRHFFYHRYNSPRVTRCTKLRMKCVPTSSGNVLS